MRTRLATGLALTLSLLAGAAGAQTSAADMGRAGAAARAAQATQDARMGAAAVTIPRGASLPSMGAAPDPGMQQSAVQAAGGGTGSQAPAPLESVGMGGSQGTRPTLLGGPPAADAAQRRGQCPSGTIRRNEGCVTPGSRSQSPSY